MNRGFLYYYYIFINSIIICNSYSNHLYRISIVPISILKQLKTATISGSSITLNMQENESIYEKNMINNISNDINNNINDNINKNIKIDINYDEDDEKEVVKTINEEIYDIIQIYLIAEANGDLFKVDPNILTNNGHILTQGRIYEDIMKGLLSNCKTNDDTIALEKVDNFLNGYIKTERKSRSRLKINYILAGASSNRFEESILLLSECDEIDEDLIDYIDSLIKKSMMNSSGPLGMIDYDENDFEESNVTIDILRMIQRRLITEKSTKGNINLRLLGQLLNEPSSKLRESLVTKTLITMESIDSFTQFVKDGIDHVSKRSTDKINEATPDISDDTLEKMKDILYSVEKLFEKLKIGTSLSENVFSTGDPDEDEIKNE